MTNILFLAIIIRVIVSLPLLYLIIFWKKTKTILKIIIIITFLLTLPTLFQEIKFESSLQHPIYTELNLIVNQTGKIYEFEVSPLKGYYIAGFEVINSLPNNFDYAYDDSNSWPNNHEDIEIIITNGETLNKYDPQKYNVRYDEINNKQYYSYGTGIKFNKLIQKTKVIYKINKHPNYNIDSVKLVLQSFGLADYQSYHRLGIYFNIILVYGSIIIFLGIIGLIHLFKKSKNKNDPGGI